MFKRFGLIRVLARGQALALLLFANAALAEDKEPFAILELGAVAEWGLSGGGSSFGPSAAVEFPVIKNWLEIETGVQKLFSRGQTELDTDLIFKKPFDLSPTVEFEPGVGRYGYIRSAAGEQPMLLEPRSWLTSCSGPRLIEISVGFWSRVFLWLWP